MPIPLSKFFSLHILTVLLMMPYSSVYSQDGHDHFMCSYYGEAIDPTIKTSPADESAQEVIQMILSVVGLKPNFEIRAANVPNAAAVIIEKKRYILYNKKFISAINSASGNSWAGISIIAHEIGHHLNGHTLSSGGSRPDIELEADEFSGFVLNKLGATLDDAQAAMSIAASQKASHTHPARKDRLIAIANGWKNAGGQVASSPQKPKKTDKNITKPVMVEIPQRAETSLLDEKYIAFDVHFDADPNQQYYITIAGNLVTVDENELYIIGRLADSNKRGYKLMLSDKNYNYLYIGAGGAIVNGSGRKVGLITQR
jgi:hypothetical protein